jgi:hypothetical protein
MLSQLPQLQVQKYSSILLPTTALGEPLSIRARQESPYSKRNFEEVTFELFLDGGVRFQEAEIRAKAR